MEITKNDMIPQGTVAEWEELAIYLGFNHGRIRVIQQNASQLDVQECSVKMLLRWWAGCSNPTVTKLITALKGINQNRDADLLEKGLLVPIHLAAT